MVSDLSPLGDELSDAVRRRATVFARRGVKHALIRAEWAPFADKEPERTAWLESVLVAHVGR